MELMNATFAELLKKSAVGTLPRQAGICANSAKYNSLVGPELKKTSYSCEAVFASIFIF